MSKKSLFILRGLPGSGKSTLAKVLSDEYLFPVFSIDDYFTDEEGNYNFDFKNNHLAYKTCELKTREAMKQDVMKIFVDNTFTMEWELDPYVKLAKEFGYAIFVMTVENRHNGLNLHNIPIEHIEKMREKFRLKL